MLQVIREGSTNSVGGSPGGFHKSSNESGSSQISRSLWSQPTEVGISGMWAKAWRPRRRHI